MTRDDIIKLAREAGLIRTGDGWTEPHRWGMTEIERFAALVAAHKTEVAIAEAYRCGYEAGVVEERESEQEPRNIRERWNIELDGDDLLVCFNDHEKSEGCRYERYVPATTTPPQRKPLTEQEQEPVVDCPRCGHCCPQRKPLTNEEIISAAKQTHSAEPGREGYILPFSFARAIEAAHNIGEKK